MKKVALLVVSHAAAIAIGFALGIYTLPILTAPKARSAAEVKSLTGDAQYTGEFRRDLKGSDFVHWGEGTVRVSPHTIALLGTIGPGPDYKLYLAPEFVETEMDFARIKDRAVRVGDVKTFENFVISVPESIDVSDYNTVVVWCESFSQFITAAKYR